MYCHQSVQVNKSDYGNVLTRRNQNADIQMYVLIIFQCESDDQEKIRPHFILIYHNKQNNSFLLDGNSAT